VFAVAAGRNIGTIRSIARTACIDPGPLTAKRKERMQKLLDLSPVATGNRELTIAIAWAKLQLDALIMNQSTGGARTKGIFAGLPWFNNYWGRDSFISLPGATYVIGNFADARDVLRSYAAFQELDSANTNYGRIPNLATPQSVIYNTADGTPWFVRSLHEYVQYSGDTSFAREMYPVVVRSIEGTLKYHCDQYGFLTHADAESWMDAVGPNGPWSPRGNRANDVQALWTDQLSAGRSFAVMFGDSLAAQEWNSIRQRLFDNFAGHFVDKTHGLIYDHLRADGTPAGELRPNQLFALDMPLPEQVRMSVVKTVLKQLVSEHGTATLAQSDSNFHPHHENPPYYVKDAAYHNGTVWTWVNGAAVRAAVRYDLQNVVFPMTMNSVRQILRRGTVGALSELLDAHPRMNDDSTYDEPKLSGTYSQAWSLAEFLRSIYQDYLGVRVDRTTNTVQLLPNIPAGMHDVQLVQRIGNGSLTISYRRGAGNSVTTTVTADKLIDPLFIAYTWGYSSGKTVHATERIAPGTTITLRHTPSALTVVNGKKTRSFDSKKDPAIFSERTFDRKYFADASLARPDLKRDFPVLRGPSHPLLPHATVKAKNPSAEILAEQTDPVGDDRGISGTYLYPSSQHFKKGILDITGASFRFDSTNLYCTLTFANLYDPGWHPEYGFQLTLAAIAVNTGEGTIRSVGANSRYTLSPERAYNRMILVGGGVRVLNADGNILCEYIPKQKDAAEPLGNVASRSIEFAVPLEYLGVPQKGWKISILVGGQDDHGGAGIGEFRTIQQDVSEWLGGGNNNSNDSNVYDVMMIH
jgi:glycogen debranching enzyme